MTARDGLPHLTGVLPLAGLHLQLGCHPAPVHGWSMPLWYEGALDEHEQTRRSAGVFDRSHLGRFYVTGERAGAVLGRVLATDPARVGPGAVGRAVACRDDGTILDIPTLCHLEPGRWLVLTGPRAGPALRALVEGALAGEDVEVSDRGPATALVSLQGPEAATVFARVFSPGFLEGVARTGHSELLLGHHRAAVVRGSHIGEPGFWLLFNPEVGSEIWRAFVDAGAVSAGLAAHDALRLEAGVLEAPLETPSPASPRAAGLDALLDLDGRDFPGVDALRAEVEPPRRIAGLRLEGPGLARAGSRVFADTIDAGACVAAAYSPVLETGIAVVYLEPGIERVDVDTGGERTPAAVVPLPFLPEP